LQFTCGIHLLSTIHFSYIYFKMNINFETKYDP
jgi:hypothetical protein